MSHQVIWTKAVINEFIEIGGLTKDEKDVLLRRINDDSIEEQACALGMSTSKVNKITKRLKIKYDEAQKFSLILQERKENAKELFKDRFKQ